MEFVLNLKSYVVKQVVWYMSKYRIKLNSNLTYTIQKRWLFVFWFDMKYREGDYINTPTWSYPPIAVLEELQKYG